MPWYGQIGEAQIHIFISHDQTLASMIVMLSYSFYRGRPTLDIPFMYLLYIPPAVMMHDGLGHSGIVMEVRQCLEGHHPHYVDLGMAG